MFEFAWGVGFGVDVADFFWLQCAFERDGVMQAAPEEEGVFLAGKFRWQTDDLSL